MDAFYPKTAPPALVKEYKTAVKGGLDFTVVQRWDNYPSYA